MNKSIKFLFAKFSSHKYMLSKLNRTTCEKNLTSDSMDGSPPASNNKTFHFEFSLNRLAITEPI